jgi:hypothetical protein
MFYVMWQKGGKKSCNKKAEGGRQKMKYQKVGIKNGQ